MIGVHIARVGVFNVDRTGNILKKDDPAITIRQQLQTEMQHRLIADADIPNTSNNPTVKDYIIAEANDDYVIQHIDQSTIITYHRTASGGFA